MKAGLRTDRRPDRQAAGRLSARDVTSVRVSRRQRARLGYVVGCVLVVAGLYLGAGLAAAVFTAGAITAVSFLVLYDVDGRVSEPPADDRTPQRFFDPTL